MISTACHNRAHSRGCKLPGRSGSPDLVTGDAAGSCTLADQGTDGPPHPHHDLILLRILSQNCDRRSGSSCQLIFMLCFAMLYRPFMLLGKSCSDTNPATGGITLYPMTRSGRNNVVRPLEGYNAI